MGNPIADATNTLEQIFNTVQTIHDLAQDDYVRPLQQFPKSDVEGLDITHDRCVQEVQKAMGNLFGPGISFEGAAATAVANLMSDYFDHESKLSNYDIDGVSIYMTQLGQHCQTTVRDLQPELDAIKDIKGPSVVVSDVIDYWSDVFHRGPQALIEDLQIGPWKLGDFPPAQFLMNQVFMPQEQAPQSALERSLLEEISSALVPVAAVILVVNLVWEVIKQWGIVWHVGRIGATLQGWANAMGDLHNEVISQNMLTPITGDIGTINYALQQENLAQLEKEFPAVPSGVIQWMLEHGLVVPQIRKILKQLLEAGMTGAEIQQLLQTLQKIGVTDLQIVNFLKNHTKDIPNIWKLYQQAKDIPGIDRVLRLLVGGAGPSFRGYYFALQWIATHRNQIAEVEVPIDGKSGPDAILKDGTIVDLKSYDWKGAQQRDNLFRKLNAAELEKSRLDPNYKPKHYPTTLEEIQIQIERYKKNYPGHPIVYIFDSRTEGHMPDDLAQMFRDEGVIVKYWP